MRKLLIILMLLSPMACVEELTKQPDIRPISATLRTAVPLARAASMAQLAHTSAIANTTLLDPACSTYPCNIRIQAQLVDGLFPLNFGSGHVLISARFNTADSGIMIAAFVDVYAGISLSNVTKVSAFPFTRTTNGIRIVYLPLNLNIDLDPTDVGTYSDAEVTAILGDLNQPSTSDPDVAIAMAAWVVEVDFQGTDTDFTDDTYMITGGGQKFALAGGDAQIVQLAMVGVTLSADCTLNPTLGLILVQEVDTGENKMGQAILNFPTGCSGKLYITLGTGSYIGSTGDSMNLGL